jgi:hypothetical protein
MDQAREDKVSIPDQVSWAKKFALEKGWEWVAEYIEPGVFGDVEPEDRPALSRLLTDARDNKFDIMLVYHSSRLAREPDIGMKVCRMLGQLRKQTYFRNAPIDPVPPDKFAWGTNIGSQYMTAFSFIGDFQENVARSERVRSGALGLAKRGKLRNAPYGYKKIRKFITDKDGRQRYNWNFEIEPEKAIIVKQIYTDYINPNGTLRQIMLNLNKKNVPSPSGKIGKEAWTATEVRNILTNPAYTGRLRWGRKLGGKYLQGKTITGKQRRVITSPEEWILVPGDQPKIINDKSHEEIQEKLKLRYVLKGRAVASKGLLIGLVKCGKCNRNAYYKTRKTKKGIIRSDYQCQSYTIYKSCQRHIMAAKKLESAVISELEHIASNPEYRKRLLNQKGEEKDKGMNKDLQLLSKAKDEMDSKQKRILIAYESGNLSLQEYGDEKRRLDEEVLGIIEKINKLDMIVADKTQAKEARKRFLKTIRNFSQSFQASEFQKQKEFFQSLISSIIVKGESIHINFRI